MSEEKNISYLNKSFGDFKMSLQQYTKTYFPTTYNDFSEASPGNMFIEMSSYVGDVMSFYLDTQVQENFLLFAKEKENLYAQAYVMGYRPKASYASTTDVDIFQLVPAITISGSIYPDYQTYGLLVPANTVLTSTNGTKFLTTQQIDFTDTSSADITYYGNNYLFKKSVPTISAEIKTTTVSFSGIDKFATTTISDTNILQILNVTGSKGSNDIYYEVPYLAQSSVFQKVANTNFSADQVPYLLKLQRVPKRFVSRFLSDNTLQLEFGAGLSSNKTDTQIIPTASNIKEGIIPGISDITNNYNEASVFYTQEYGIVPSGSLTIKYLVGGGIASNIPANDLNTIDTSGIIFKNAPGSLSGSVLESVVSTNPNPSTGGRDGDTSEEVRQNALYAYSSQLRTVTKEDYIVRTLSMPSDYGVISKAYVSQDFYKNPQETTGYTHDYNPLALDLYVLSYNSDKQLTTASTTLKNNLVTYLNQYRMVTDAVNIRDAYYINIGVNFDITVMSGYSNKDVLTGCIEALKDYFDIAKWQINQPIVISEVMNSLMCNIKGLQAIVKIEIVNKQGTLGSNTYSQYGYDIAGATRKGNIYPSIDPAIFEVRYPNTDIQGRVVVS
jgi:hypothetical protein